MERRTLDELIALYSLEPTLRDIYVEGPTDKSVFEWFTQSSDLSSVGVFDVASIEVAPDTLREFNVDNNNKGRLIALAHILDRNLDEKNAATCIVDKDYDDILGRSECRMLLGTDFSCIEMYSLNEKVLSKMIALGIRRNGLTPAQIIDALNNIGRELFLIKLANLVLGLALAEVDWDNCCSINGKAVSFNKDEYIRRYLNASGQLRRFDEFVEVAESFRGRLSPDLRNCLNGHDFVEIIEWYLRKAFRSKKSLDAEEISRLLFVSLEYPDIVEEPMFSELLSRISS